MSNIQGKQNNTILSFAGPFSQLRAYVYAMLCGDNNFLCNEYEFVAGCNRFGLDNPSPIVTRRLAAYGNEEPIEKIVEKLARQYNDSNIIDPEKFG